MPSESFEAHRQLLFSVAYRMLGSASDAEDIVQDVWMRYAESKPADLRSLKAWLTTVATRLCLDRLKSARATREQYVGPWLPEPILTPSERPDAMLQRHESVTLAFLVLLETLSAEERAVFLLKDIFDYSHEEIAEMLEMSAANSRQLLHRAKARIAEGRPRGANDEASKREMARRFVAAFESGDPLQLSALLAEDVKFFGDGGGKVAAARRPVIGRDAVINLLHGIHRAADLQGMLPSVSIETVEVNFEPAFVVRLGGRLDSVYSLEIADERVRALRVIRNPDKLAFIDRQLTLR
jgi:RNA polymerase sigma-70 factor (ECF subfamily)